MSTYLVQLLTGEYAVLDGGRAGAVPLVNVALTADVARMQPYFDLTDDQLAFFARYFGPYPLDRYGLAMTESDGGLAMETQGRSLFSRADFPGGEPGYVEHLLLSHELAHQWFGDAVSPADWSDLWLNESFATYAQWMWLDEAGLSTIENDASFALATRNTIGTEPTGSPTVANLFGFERYDGGAVVLHALRREIGDDRFFPLLARWVAEHDGTSRTTDDFIALAEVVADRSLTTFFDEWLFATDIPDAYPN
jgi:aminopeptidase N